MQTDVIIALGSNLGNPEENLILAIEQLASLFGKSLQSSSFWQSEPQEMASDAGLFLNAVVTGSCRLEVADLLLALQKIEASMGRGANHGYHESRCIDLDIITYGPSRLEKPGLIVPHPRAHKRLFVLLPLAELMPDLVLPGFDLKVSELIGHAPNMVINRLPRSPALRPPASP